MSCLIPVNTRSNSKTEIPPLPYEEWDFRMIESDPETLRTAIEYEYLRSSSLRQIIESWHAAKISELGLHERLSMDFAFWKTGITSEHINLDSDDDGLMDRDYEEWLRLHTKKITRFKRLKKQDCTISEFIRRVFENVQSAGVSLILESLKDLLPELIVKYYATDITLRFDRFPEPWLKLPKDYTAARFDRALNPADQYDEELNEQFAPFREIHHLFDEGNICAEVPGLYLGYFIVDFNAGAPAIEEAFKRWLTWACPERKPGRRNQEGWLQRLTAYRLIKCAGLTVPQAYKIANERKTNNRGANIDALHVVPSPSFWSRSVKRAERDLNSNFIKEIRRSFNIMSFTLFPRTPRFHDVAKGLKLTQAQQQQIHSIRIETYQKAKTFSGDFSLNQIQRNEQFLMIRSEACEQIEMVLTPEQSAQIKGGLEEIFLPSSISQT